MDSVTVRQGNTTYEFRVEGGTPYREEQPALLGKRLVCAQRVRVQVDGHDPEMRDVSGTLEGPENTFYLGCGTEALVIRASEDLKGPWCCGMPMARQGERILPSSD